MQIREIRVDDGDFASWFGVTDAVDRHDLPDYPRWLEREQGVRYTGTDYRSSVLWLAENHGVAVGAAGLIMSLKDNLRLGTIEIAVLPGQRRRGVGTALLREVERYATNAGRSSLLSFLNGSLGRETTPGTAFAERFGFTNRITDVMRVQRAPFDLNSIAALEREVAPRALDSTVASWRRVPEEYVAEYARLAGRMSTDPPMGELDYEPEVWDVDRVRKTEQRVVDMGREMWVTAVVSTDGNLAGMTELTMAFDSDEWAYQGDTIVDPAHRGHRLGLLLKIANLRALLADRPAVKAICTWNAGSNEHMISVNEQLGYVEHGWGAEYQRG